MFSHLSITGFYCIIYMFQYFSWTTGCASSKEILDMLSNRHDVEAILPRLIHPPEESRFRDFYHLDINVVQKPSMQIKEVLTE